MSNESVREMWAERFGRPDPKIVCVGLNYAAHAGETGRRGAEVAAAVRQVREHAALATATRSSCSPESAMSTPRPSSRS